MVRHSGPVLGKQQKMPWINRLYSWACERLYHEFAWSYDIVSWGVSFGHWQHWRNTVWPHVQGESLLELGCGPGHLLAEGRARGYRMVGVDLSPAMLVMARRRLGEFSTGKLVQANGRRLPFGDQSFATVVATFPAGYILTAETVRECWRVLQPSGNLVVAGLWVRGPRWTTMLPVFYSSPDAHAISTLLGGFTESAFDATVVELADGQFRIGAIIAQKVRT